MANLTQTAMADAIKTQYERRLLMRALPRLIHGRFIDRARLNKFGSYELRRYESLAAVTSAIGTEGATPTEQSAPTLTKITITPLFYGAWIGYTDELDFTAMDPIVLEMSGILGEQAGLSADTLYRDALTANATKDYSGGKTARNQLLAPQHAFTYADFVRQIAALEAANASPVDGEDFIVIMHPHSWATLMLDPVFVNLFERAPGDSSPIRSGFVGRILRCKIFVSSNSREYADGGADSLTDVYSMLFIARQAYGAVGIAGDEVMLEDGAPEGFAANTGKSVKPVSIIAKGLGSAGADDPLDQRGSLAWKFALGLAAENAAFIRDIEHVNEFSLL